MSFDVLSDPYHVDWGDIDVFISAKLCTWFKKMKLCSWNKKALPRLFWGKGWLPKETLALMNISLAIMTNCDNSLKPNSTNAAAEKCPYLRFEIWDVCFWEHLLFIFSALSWFIILWSQCSVVILNAGGIALRQNIWKRDQLNQFTQLSQCVTVADGVEEVRINL